jgi:hypothetical protein
MAMTKEGMALKIKDRLQAIQGWGNSWPYAQEYLEAFCQGILDEVIANGQIDFASGDIPIDPQGTPPMLDSLVQPVTGKGKNDEVTLVGKIS